METTYHDQVRAKLDRLKSMSFHMSINVDFIQIIQNVENDLKANTNSSKFAAVLIKHQFMQEMVLSLINHSITYVQVKTWPVIFDPKNVPTHKDQTFKTIKYLEQNCIDFKNKSEFIRVAAKLNTERNSFAHKLILQNADYILKNYPTYKSNFERLTELYVKSENNISNMFDPTLYKLKT